MKILIADDEQLVRISLVSMIQEMEPAWEIAGEAKQGEEMLELLAHHRPDVAIVDIRMPKLDGIEVIRRGRELSPHTKWIILSGFSDFQYAQQALKLGVNEYLLKPVVPEELERAIRTIDAQNKKQLSLLNCQFENRLFSLCQGLTSLADEPEDSLLCKGSYQALLFHFDSPLDARDLEAKQSEFSAMIRKSLPNYLVQGAHLALFTLNGTGYVATGVWNPESEAARQSVRLFFRHAEETASRIRDHKLAVTAVLTEECDRFQQYVQQIQQVHEWKGFHIVYGMNRTWRLRDVQQQLASGSCLELSQYFLRLADHYRNKMYLDYQNTLANMNIWFGQHADRLLTDGMRRNIQEYVRLAMELAMPDEDWQQWISYLKDCGERWLWQHSEAATPPDLIDQVLRYMEENYMNNIGLNQIADELKVNPSYLSNLFHKKTGTTFIKYLIRLRILKAKELLSSTNLQVQKVAERVGYYSTRYFTKLFVETVGVYPSDFRNQHSQISREQIVSEPRQNKTRGNDHVRHQS